MRIEEGALLRDRTTLRVGGAAKRVVTIGDETELVELLDDVERSREELFVLGEGSNVVVSDRGFPGTVVQVAVRGIEVSPSAEGALADVGAGEPWDEVVRGLVAEGWAGLECLAGIPGWTGATPIQNVGAYGQEVSETIASVRAWDRENRAFVELAARDCAFAYRRSRFKGSDRFIVTRVRFSVRREPRKGNVAYEELARALGVPMGSTVPVERVREAVLGLRRKKGMVLDPSDPDTVSAGSFFTNPILEPDVYRAFSERAARVLGPDTHVPVFAQPDGTTKVAAAFLIERSGFGKGYVSGRVGISSKHALAIKNLGGATASELLAFARTIQGAVFERFGVHLEPEPIIVQPEPPLRR